MDKDEMTKNHDKMINDHGCSCDILDFILVSHIFQILVIKFLFYSNNFIFKFTAKIVFRKI